jgi:hypothetical protein
VLTLSGGTRSAAIEAALSTPFDVLLDEAKGFLYITDTGNGVIQRFDRNLGTMTPVAEDLGKPVALAIDTSNELLYVVDAEQRDVIEVDLNASTARSLGGLTVFGRPISIAFHEFSDESRFLFVADGGIEGSPPRIRIFNLNTNTAGSLELDDNATVFRLLFDIAAAALPDNGVDLFIAADVGDSDLGTTGAFGTFERDCFEGEGGVQDQDVDGRRGLDDDDCTESLASQVLVVRFPATGPDFGEPPTATASATSTLGVVGRVRFRLRENCQSEGRPVPDLPSFDIRSIALDPLGTRLFVADRARIAFAEFAEPALQILDSGIIAGTEEARALPFDGNVPLSTRFGRIGGLQVDALDNVYFADILNNRARRFWIEPSDILPDS